MGRCFRLLGRRCHRLARLRRGANHGDWSDNDKEWTALKLVTENYADRLADRLSIKPIAILITPVSPLRF